jgi:ADP-heptose:LPS heptosyltransferase
MLKVLVSWLRWRARRSQKSTFLPSGVRTLVAVELTRLGDFVTILPPLRALRKSFPAARIFVVTAEDHAPLLALCEEELHVISVRKPSSLIGFLRALRAVRATTPDLVCSMGPANRNAALALASGATFIVGYLNGTDSLTPFLGVTPVESIGFNGGGNVTFTSENIQDRPWKVFQSIGLNAPRDPLINFPRWNPDAARMARLLPLGLKRHYVVIHPFSGWEYRSWPLAQFRSLGEILLHRLPFDLVFICSGREDEVMMKPLRIAFSGNERVVFAPSNDIMDSAAITRHAELFIGNDSGPLHLAALLGVPVLGLYGPAPPERTAPYSGRGMFLYRKVSCSPCTQTVCSMPENSCMNRITVEDVYDVASGLLGRFRADSVASHG